MSEANMASVNPPHVRVVDWNVNGFRRKHQPEFLDAQPWDIALLQEVTRSTWPAFAELGSDAAVAFDHLPAMADDGPRYACGVVVRAGARILDQGVVRDVPSPERALVATVEMAGQRFTAASWAAPPGVSWGKAGKGRQVVRFAAWLRDRTGPVLVGIDRNAPRWERFNLADDEWWNKREPYLYGPDRVHDLRDVYREVVERDAALRDAIPAERPDGPLAVSHVRRGIACRYDTIYASPEFAVDDVRYLWDEAREAGSDHALVAAELTLAASPQE